MYELSVKHPGILILVNQTPIRTPFKIRVSEKELHNLTNILKINGIYNFSYIEIAVSESPTIHQLSNEQKNGQSFHLSRQISYIDENPVENFEDLKVPENPTTNIKDHIDCKDIKIVELQKLSQETIDRISRKIY